MFSLQRTTQLASFALLSLLLIAPVYTLPFSARQQDGSHSFTTVTTTMTNNGPITETCTIVLTPTTDKNGQLAVQEVKTCTVQPNGANSISSPVASISITSASGTTESTSEVPPSPTISSSLVAVSTTSTVSSVSVADPQAVTSSVASAVSSSSAITVNPVPTVNSGSVSNTVTSSSASGTGNPVSTNSISTASTSPSSTNPTDTPTSSSSASAEGANTSSPSPTTSSGSGTAAAADTSSSGFSLPGKKLSVLPIGLGVFAGISVIALIVVGLVTYERTKYRKAFRQRKLAESGAAMGYGGMSR